MASNFINNSPINPARGGHSDHLKKLESLFGNSNTSVHANNNNSPRQPLYAESARNKAEARFNAAFKPVAKEQKPESNEQSGPMVVNKAPSAYKIRLERIRTAKPGQELEDAVHTFLQSHDLPNDIGVLLQVIKHPNEEYVRKGLAEIVGMLDRKELAGTALVTEAIADLETKALASETKSYIDGIKAMLARY